MIACLITMIALAEPMTEVEAHTLMDELQQTLVRVHPEPFARVPRQEQDALFEQAKARLTGKVQPDQLAAEGMRVVSALRDAHTSLRFGGEDRFVSGRFEWVEDGLLLVEADGFEPAAVTRIGGRTPDELHAQLWSIVSAENEHWVRERGERLIAARSTWLALDGKAGSVAVELADGQRGRLTFDRTSPLGGPRTEPSTWWTLVPEAHLGWLRIARCPSPDQAYRDRIDDLFYELAAQDVQTLVIDVRGNGGGDSAILHPVLEHLAPDQLASYGGFRRLSADAVAQREIQPGEYPHMQGDTDLTQPATNTWTKSRRYRARTPFRGEVLVLADQGTFSSGNWIAVMLSDNGLATVVGSPTGNAPSSYGDLLTFDIGPFDLGVSYSKWLRPDPDRDPANTLVPDVLVPITVADILSGEDPQWAWVLERQGAEGHMAPPAPRPGLTPTVVRTVPPLGSHDVDPGLDTLVIEFSEPMMDSLSLVGGGESFPQLVGKPAWTWTSPQRLEISVELAPGRAYDFGINSARYDGFKAQDGTPVHPVRWRFATAR